MDEKKQFWLSTVLTVGVFVATPFWDAQAASKLAEWGAPAFLKYGPALLLTCTGVFAWWKARSATKSLEELKRAQASSSAPVVLAERALLVQLVGGRFTKQNRHLWIDLCVRNVSAEKIKILKISSTEVVCSSSSGFIEFQLPNAPIDLAADSSVQVTIEGTFNNNLPGTLGQQMPVHLRAVRMKTDRQTAAADGFAPVGTVDGNNNLQGQVFVFP